MCDLCRRSLKVPIISQRYKFLWNAVVQVVQVMWRLVASGEVDGHSWPLHDEKTVLLTDPTTERN